MIKKLLGRWKQYKYRFVPWLATNINENSPRFVSETVDDKIISDHAVDMLLEKMFNLFQQNQHLPTDKWHHQNNQLMMEYFGFQIGRLPSSLPDGGRGVFVTEGNVRAGTIVAMYPGLVYQPWEPVFWVSLANSFLFRCADGIYIDGKDTGLSKMMYNSCAKRDRVMGQFMCDTTWLEELPVNPLGIGQYVNNQSPGRPANVAYQEFDVPLDFPFHLRKFLPNTEARLQQDLNTSVSERLLRVVVLVSIREIMKGEELFSTYYTIVKKDNT